MSPQKRSKESKSKTQKSASSLSKKRPGSEQTLVDVDFISGRNIYDVSSDVSYVT